MRLSMMKVGQIFKPNIFGQKRSFLSRYYTDKEAYAEGRSEHIERTTKKTKHGRGLRDTISA